MNCSDDRKLYFAPDSLNDALVLLNRYPDESRIVAGGTDLIVKMKKGLISPMVIIDIKKIAALQGITEDPRGIWIGAAVSHSEVEKSALIRREIDFLAEACSQVGSVQIRNRATIGGNLCNASPAADTAPPLLAADASVAVEGPGGKRLIPLDGFFQGLSSTLLSPREILTGFFIPKMRRLSAGVYLRHTLRKAMDVSKVGVAVTLTGDEKGDVCTRCRIALGAVGPVPFRARRAEQSLVGTDMNAVTVEKAGALAAEEARPVTDVRSLEEHRKVIVAVLTVRAIRACWTVMASSARREG